MVCKRASGPIVVDGKADDAAWAGAASTSAFGATWQKRQKVPAGHTTARLLYDDTGIYFFAEMIDAKLVPYSKIDDDELWKGDVFELFLQPHRTTTAYYEFQVNPDNAKLDMYLPKRQVDGYKRWKSSRKFSWQTAVQHTDQGWNVEGYIPWIDFAVTGGRPRDVAVWGFNIARYDYNKVDELKPLRSCTAPITKPSFHRYHEWGVLRFE